MEAAVEQQNAAIRNGMGPSLNLQRRAVHTQARMAVEAPAGSDSFFTIPWPKPVAEVAAADCVPLPREAVDALVNENAKREGLKPELLREVMRRESGFRPCAVSTAGAQGLMQLMPTTAEQFHVTDPFDPAQNVAAGARFLRVLLDRYAGDLTLALGAYNSGPRRVSRAGGVPDIPETQSYVGAILGALSVY